VASQNDCGVGAKCLNLLDEHPCWDHWSSPVCDQDQSLRLLDEHPCRNHWRSPGCDQDQNLNLLDGHPCWDHWSSPGCDQDQNLRLLDEHLVGTIGVPLGLIKMAMDLGRKEMPPMWTTRIRTPLTKTLVWTIGVPVWLVRMIAEPGLSPSAKRRTGLCWRTETSLRRGPGLGSTMV
jgi:hypothetical protein